MISFDLEKEADAIKKAALKGKVVTLVTYILRDSGEARLQKIIEIILNIYDRTDLLELLYTSIKEMVINATKANLKRLIFEEKNFKIKDKKNYEEGMKVFREELTEKQLVRHERKFKEKNYPIDITFVHSTERILLKVKNHFTLYPQEEARIREKAAKSMEFEDLVQFYMDQGDNTEGAGMGITLITILLRQVGVDPHCFTIYSNEYNETVSRLELPLDPNYIPKRQKNGQLLKAGKITLEELRKNHQYIIKL